jgi:MOSC domain-containing protein YiiM
MTNLPIAEAIFVGQPKTIHDQRGYWTSSIFRERISGPVHVSHEGLAGDRVTQPYHGGPGAAVCVHPTDHYRFWNQRYGMHLEAGNMGENVTLDGITEDQIFVGDIVRLGTALLQVSGPRVPCGNLARRIGRPNWVKLTIQENRTGFYMRVLEPGRMQAGDAWEPQERLNQNASIPQINHCLYIGFDANYAKEILQMDGLEEWWKTQAREKFAGEENHWTDTISR